MSKSVALLLVLVFLTAPCIMVAKPAYSSADTAEDTWATKASMHEARGGLGVAVVNGKIYAIGGSTKTGAPQNYTGGTVGTNEEYDPETDKWTLKAPMPTPRSNFRFEVVHNKIYCIGGLTYNGSVTHAIEVYDPSTDTWETIAPMPTPRESFTTVVYNDRIYVIGGITGRDLANGLRGTYTGATEVYDPALDTWETKASMVNARFPETCVVINGKIYVISGSTTYAESVSITAVYDEATNSWTNKASMPVVKHGASATMDDKIYFIGGSYEDSVYVTLLQIYDPLTDTWSKGASPPQGGVNQGSAFATTGEMSLRRIYVVDYNLRIYDPKKNEWTLGPNRTTNRYSMGIAVLNEKIYVIGGMTTIFPGFISPPEPTITTYATNEVYTPVGYGTPDPSYVLATTPPEMSLLSPLNQTYYNSSVALVFTLDKPVNWTSYSLDGELNVTVAGNTTLTGLSFGLHNVTVYAEDTFGNVGASETVWFSVAEPFPAAPVAAASAVAIAVAVAGLLFYFRKRKKVTLMKRAALALILAFLVSAIAGTLLVNLLESNSTIASLKVSAQPIESEVIHKEITIMPDGSFVVDYLCDNGTYVYDTNPEVPISRNIFGNYYTFTGDVYGHLVIERDNIVVDGAGHKLQLEGHGSFAISAGIRDRAHSNSEFVGTNNVVITNMVIEDFGYGIELAGSNNLVSNITLTEGGYLSGITIWNSGSNNIIRRCRIFANEGTGIYVAGSGAIITDNYIANNDVGIGFPGSAGTLRNNKLVNNGRAFDFDTLPSTSDVIDASNTVDGKPVCCWVNEHDQTVPSEAGYVLLSNCTNVTVQGTSIFNSSNNMACNSNGLYLHSTKDSLIKNNYMQAGAGIKISSSCQNITLTENYVGSGGISLTSSSNVSVTNNYVQSSGISLGSTTNCLISKNTLRGCVTGVSLRTAHQNRILQNNIAECDIGISIFKSDENVFSGNNFISNEQDVWEQHYTWEWPSYRYHESVNNKWDRNYWSNYTGRDKDGDGIGDIPHVIYEDKKDNYPLMSSVDIPEIIPEPMNSSASPSPTTAVTSTPLPSWGNVAVVVIVVVVILVVVVGAGLLVYFKKRNH